MDVSLTPSTPRAVQDLRPSADLAATARIATPVPALPPAASVVPPVSPSQVALLARGLLDLRPVPPAGAVDGSGETMPRTSDRSPPRVLKPWGVLMLPADEHEISVIGAGPNAGEPQKLGDDSSETDVTSDLST